LESENQIRKPFLIVVSVAVIFSALSFIPTQFNIFNFTSKKIDFFSDLTRKNSLPPKKEIQELRKPYPDFVDKDSLSFKKGFYRIQNFSDVQNDQLALMCQPLINVKTKGKKVRIAWFGDSLIEGDIIIQDVRNILQKKFGGKGVGMMPITTIPAELATFRQSIAHQFSNNWKTISLAEKGKEATQSVSGEVFIPHWQKDSTAIDTGTKISADFSWVAYETVKRNQTGLDTFHVIKLFYSHVDSSAHVRVIKNGRWASTLKLEKGNALHVLTLNDSIPCQSIKLIFQCLSEMYVYGVSFESDEGIHVDCFSMRGSSGVPMSVLNTGMMNSFQQQLNYNLIVLQFGLNIVTNTSDNYDWYKRSFVKTLDHVKECFPGAAIMIASCSDRSTKRNGEYVTMTYLPAFVDTQESMASHEHLLFWNLFEAMGGEGSMAAMVDSKDPLANKDYTHFKAMGGAMIAEDFSYALLYEYNHFLYEEEKKKNKNMNP